jgi:hypothetical protein
MGPCQCAACKVRFQERYGRPLPTSATDAEYRAFMSASAREVAATFAELIHRKRPEAAFLTYIQDHTDGIMSESNTAVGRALPLWLYSASDNVNRARNSEPGKMAFNLSMSRARKSASVSTRTSLTAVRQPSRWWGRWIRRIGNR